MGVFQAIKSGFGSIAKNIKLWLLLVGISIALMIVTIPIMLAIFGGEMFQPGVAPTPEQMANVNWVLFVPFIIIMILVQTFVNAGVMGSIKDIIKTNSLSLANFVGHAKKFFVRLILFGLIMLLIMLGLGLIVTLLGALTGAIGKAVGFLGALLGIILGVVGLATLILVGTYGSLVPPIIATEDKGILESMSAAFNFLKANLLKSVGLAIVLWVIFLVVGVINNVLVAAGGAIAFPVTMLTNIINIYLTLVYIASFMSFYLGNAGSGTPPPETAPGV